VYRWDRCIRHRGRATLAFMGQHFGEQHRRCLLLCAASFDPRSPHVGLLLSRIMGNRLRALIFREERPNAPARLARATGANQVVIEQAAPRNAVAPINVFAMDGAVTGGREAVRAAQQIDADGITDIVVDCSTLSIGVGFPLVRYLLEFAARLRRMINLHLIIVHEPLTDAQVAALPSDRVEPVLGFKGGLNLEQGRRAAKLWVPHLATGLRATLDRIYMAVEPHDVCPVLPFPASWPRAGDELCEHYRQEFENTWDIDARNLLYADEGNPLDLYRTLLRIDDVRKRGFAEVGGSLLVLSPVGGRALAVGALMAAAERDFPVVHVEAVGYRVALRDLAWSEEGRGEVIHVWLAGEAYS